MNAAAEHTFEAEGYEITVTRSAGTDGAVVIFIDGADVPLRVHLNDAEIHIGTPYGEHDDSLTCERCHDEPAAFCECDETEA